MERQRGAQRGPGWRRFGMVVAAAALLASGCERRAPATAPEIVVRSVLAHGGGALTAWKTMAATGRVRMQDGIAYNAAYKIYAQMPDKVRVEHDLTADRGRAFYEYFLNGGVAWTRRNIVVSPYALPRAQSLLDQCHGIGFYYRTGVGFERRPDTQVVWPRVDGWAVEDVPGPRPAYVVVVTVRGETRELAIDTETYLLLQEKAGNTTRYFTAVQDFRGVQWPTRILEVVKTPNRETVTPFVIESVAFNAPIDSTLFTEDMPKAGRPVRAATTSPE